MNNSLNIDFRIARRLNSAGVVIGALMGVGRFLRAAWWSFAYILVKSPHLFIDWRFWLVLFGLLILAFIIAYVQYRHFTYYVDEDGGEFVVNQGVFSKSKTVIKFDNILQVKMKQNIVQQALDLYAIEIDSAGSKESEANLYALDEGTAIQLKKYLSDRYLDKQETDGSTVENTDISKQDSAEASVFRIPNWHILLVSLFTNYGQGLTLFFAFVITTFGSFAEHLDIEGVMDWYDDAEFSLLIVLYYLGAALVIIIFIPFLINLVRYFITYFNFELRRNSKGNVFMHYGLFHIKDVILSRTKVQTLNRVQNPILKALGLSVMSLKQVVTDEAKAESGVVIMPGINQASINLLFDVLHDQDVYTGMSILKPRIGLFISRMVKATILFGLLWIPLYFNTVPVELYWSLGMLYLLIMLYNLVYYLKHRLLVSDRFIIKRHGVWDMEDEIIPIEKIVTADVSQTIFQKISGSGNLTVSTPAGSVGIRFFDKQRLITLSNRVLYQIEKD